MKGDYRRERRVSVRVGRILIYLSVLISIDSTSRTPAAHVSKPLARTSIMHARAEK